MSTTQTTVNAKAKATKTMKAKDTPIAQEAKAETKKGEAKVFQLIAGKIAIQDKRMAMSHHIKAGNLVLTNKGIELTVQGAAKFSLERIANDPATFQRFANWVQGVTKEVPQEYKGQTAIKIDDKFNFPNSLYWGGFTTGNMRKMFAALWATPV